MGLGVGEGVGVWVGEELYVSMVFPGVKSLPNKPA